MGENPELIAMARRIAASIYRNQPGAHEAGYDQYIADGNNDADEAVQAALAAIIETQERDAAGPWLKVGTFEPEPNDLYLVQGTMRTSVKRGSEIDEDNALAAAIRSGQHYGKDHPHA